MRDNVAAAAGGNAARRHTRALQLLHRVGGVAAAVPPVSHPPGSSNMFQVTSENEVAPLSHDAAGEGMMMNCSGSVTIVTQPSLALFAAWAVGGVEGCGLRAALHSS